MNLNPLIITGMHRSGTSLIARFIHHSGIHLGDHLLAAKKSNKYGHFEDIEILNFQRQILLREFGRQMWVLESPTTRQLDRERAKIIIEQRAERSHWGWKEPRTCLFLDFWHRLLPGAHYLFIVRHPIMVLDSLARRHQTRFYQLRTHNLYLKAWLAYNQACRRFFHTYPDRCTMVTLEHVLQEPTDFINLLSKCLSYPFSSNDFFLLYDEDAISNRPHRLTAVSPWLYHKSTTLYAQLLKETDL